MEKDTATGITVAIDEYLGLYYEWVHKALETEYKWDTNKPKNIFNEKDDV